MRFGLYFDPVRSDDTPEVVEDPLCDLRFIHGIDMDMAASVRNQVDDLMGSVYDPGLLHGFRRVSEAVYKSGELGPGMMPARIGTVTPASLRRYR